MATMTEITLDKRVDDLREETTRGFTKTDARIDDLREETHRGFARVDQRFEEQARRIDQRFAQVDQRFDEQARNTSQRFDRVEGDIRELRGDLHREVNGLRTEMKDGFAALDSKFDAKFDSLNRTIVWLLGGSLSVVSAGILAAVFHALF
jgi:DNA anti-recombination protein RmuC